jgi:hypothetical protein
MVEGLMQSTWGRVPADNGNQQNDPAGLEPAIPGSVGRCLIHWATGPDTIDASGKHDCRRKVSHTQKSSANVWKALVKVP